MINLLANPAFQGNWRDTANGQEPDGWHVYGYPPGVQVADVLTKGAGGKTVPTSVQSLPRIVHKLASQLPPDEQINQPRSLLNTGPDGITPNKVLKLFDTSEAQAVALNQQLKAKAGQKCIGQVLLCVECTDKAPELLERDHVVVQVAVNGMVQPFYWGDLYKRHDIAGNQRAFALLSVTGNADGLGNVTFDIFALKNWYGTACIFVSWASLVPVDDAPVTPPAPVVTPPPVVVPPVVSPPVTVPVLQPGTVQAFQAALANVELRVGDVSMAMVNIQQTNALRMAQMQGEFDTHYQAAIAALNDAKASLAEMTKGAGQ